MQHREIKLGHMRDYNSSYLVFSMLCTNHGTSQECVNGTTQELSGTQNDSYLAAPEPS